jgi:hypothetical protein
MPGPHDNGNQRSLLADLIGNLDERPCKPIDFPGRAGVRVGLWALTLYEEQEARREAYAYVRTVAKFSELDLAWEEQQCVKDAVATEILAKALRDPEVPIREFTASAQELRDRLGPDEIDLLMAAYNAYRAERYPLSSGQSAEKEVDQLVELVGKGSPIHARVSWLDTASLRKCLHTAVGRLASSMTGKSSQSSPQSASP